MEKKKYIRKDAKTRGMDYRSRKFLNAYRSGLSVYESAIEAGYGYHTSKAIETVVGERGEIGKFAEYDLKVKNVIEESKKIAFCDPAKLFDSTGQLLPIGKIPADLRHAISGMKTTEKNEQCPHCGRTIRLKVYDYKLWDKNKALEHLYRHLGEFHDKVDINIDSAITATVAAAKDSLPPDQAEKFLSSLASSLGVETLGAKSSKNKEREGSPILDAEYEELEQMDKALIE